MCCLVLALLCSLVIGGDGAPTPSFAALQLLQHLGLDGGGSMPAITQGERRRQGDSPIYYIKLPPVPYYYVNNNIYQPQSFTTPFPFEQIGVDFTSNGRPDQIYHWNQAPTTSNHWSYGPTTTHAPTTTTSTTTTTTTPPPPTTTTQKPAKKPWLTLDKYFPYNGKPSGIYVWKPRPALNVNKYKHRYFTHFNY